MPNIVAPIPDVEKSITRPVVLDIARQLSLMTGMPIEAKHLYPGDTEESYQKGSTIGEVAQGLDRDRTETPFNTQLHYTVTEQPFLESMSLTQARKVDNVPFFADSKLGVLIRPVLKPTEITLEIAYRSQSKSKAHAWRHQMESRLVNYGDMNLHRAVFSYMLPLHLVDTLMEIHYLRENVAGYGDSFGKYLAEHSTSRLTIVANQAGNKQALTVAETYDRIIGLYDFTVSPDRGNGQEESGTWTTTFTYKFHFDKPIECNMVYPIAVHNQMLDDRYQVFDANAPLDNTRKRFSISGAMNYFFEQQEAVQRSQALPRVFKAPANDEYEPDNEVCSTTTIATVLCGVSEDSQEILDLNTIEEFEFTAAVKEYLQAFDYKMLHVPYACPYHISLYKNGRLMDADSIRVTSDLKVVATKPLNLRDYHQIRISLVTPIDNVRIEALRRLEAYPEALVRTLMAMGVSMGELKLLSPRIDLVRYMQEYLPDTGPSMCWINMNRIERNTVMAFFVLTGHKDRIVNERENVCPTA